MRFTHGPRGGTGWRKGRCRADHCRRIGPIYRRGLTMFCYMKLQVVGRLDEFPPLWRNRSADEVLDEWLELATRPPQGTTTADIAERMGMTTRALQRALSRARVAGDERAIYLPHGRTGVVYDPTRDTLTGYRRRNSPRTKDGA